MAFTEKSDGTSKMKKTRPTYVQPNPKEGKMGICKACTPRRGKRRDRTPSKETSCSLKKASAGGKQGASGINMRLEGRKKRILARQPTIFLEERGRERGSFGEKTREKNKREENIELFR